MTIERALVGAALSDVAAALAVHVSPINARVIMERVRRVLRDSSQIAASERDKVLSVVRVSGQLFVDRAHLESLVAAVATAMHADTLPTSRARSILVNNEDDLRVARVAARDLCTSLGASSLVVQRVATVVSELARNILSYTPGGSIELEPLSDTRPLRLRVIAEDRGTGIPNLDRILSGNYRSKTGLGRGLLGVKQLMERFEIATGSTGTRITAEAVLR